MDFVEFVLAGATGDLGDEAAARGHADALEFRMDIADDPRSVLGNYRGQLELIATNRAEEEGGEAPEAPERLATLEVAADHPLVGAIDVELATVERGEADDLIAYARERGTAVVVSTHDFEGTPEAETMIALLERACEYGDVGKLAVTATDPTDVLSLLSVTARATAEGRTVATMAMGEAGRHSRAVAPIYGSRIGYAPVRPGAATAPGQYDLATLSDLVERLAPRRNPTKG
ncbi:MAG: type I 3-dehydroquinate dehydratase [Haloarculaceae archaeon]